MKRLLSIIFSVVICIIAATAMSIIVVGIRNSGSLWFIPLLIVFAIIEGYIMYLLDKYIVLKKPKKQPPTYYDSILNKAEMHRKRKRME